MKEGCQKSYISELRKCVGHEPLANAGVTIAVVIDRPLGSTHPQYPDMVYLVNYGYVEGVLAADGDEQDVYVLGVSEPLEVFKGKMIAIIHRHDDVEEKWVVCPFDTTFTRGEIERATNFQELYFDSWVEML